MSGTVELLGGPLDGRRISPRVLTAFVWIDVRQGNLSYPRPGKHRVLYRRWRDRPSVRGARYLFAGHTHALCGGCGAYVERVDGHVVSCSLCGGALQILP